jgi:hypothetical protein
MRHAATPETCPCECHGRNNWHPCSIAGGCGHLHHTAPHLDTIGRCQLCNRPPRAGGVLCWTHTDTISHMLNPNNHGDPDADVTASIPVLYAMLNPTPSGGHTGDRRPPGFTSRPAATLHTVVMRDDRSVNNPQTWYPAAPNGRPDLTRPHTEDDNPPRAVRRALEGITDALVEHLELVGPPHPTGRFLTATAVTDLCAWLHTHLDDITAHPDADDIHNDLLDLTNQLRPAVGDHKQPPIGPCIVLIPDRHTQQYRECGAPLHLPPPVRDDPRLTPDQALRQVVITCPRCHEPYRWLDLVRIRYINQPHSA